MKEATVYPNMHRVTMTHNEQILWKHGDYFYTWCKEMDEMGYDVITDGVFERLQHDPHQTTVYSYPKWRVTKREVVA
tara:strand:- start:59 stop:289 length:231 start_codon:yes stop_codon:yes gene_type:complete